MKFLILLFFASINLFHQEMRCCMQYVIVFFPYMHQAIYLNNNFEESFRLLRLNNNLKVHIRRRDQVTTIQTIEFCTHLNK